MKSPNRGVREPRAWKFLMGPALLLIGACARQPGSADPTTVAADAAQSLAERLASEAARVPKIIGPNGLLLTALFIFVAIVAARAVNGVVHGLWRLGLDHERRLGRWVVFTKIALGLLVAYAVLSRCVQAAPILSGGAVLLFAAVGLSTLRGSIENLASGVELAFRSRFRPGDRISVGDYSGTVREIGLTSVRLRSADGTTIFLPNRLLNRHATLVTRADNTARVVVEIRTIGAIHPDLLERVRCVTLLSPYRSIGTKVKVEQRTDGVLEVELQAQSAVVVADAETQLVLTVRQLLAEDRPRESRPEL